ncbi:MAG: thioredoxin domain-containing protein, partial [Verrucomicrobia bacterium]|nr:thioredoxin domain-containing protein [Verrucomicrobiota bacterium]
MEHKHTNRLAKEKSPYLLQHAHNPVDWFPWGDEAFAQARAEDKPIFLSIGYSTCHWCHVMAHESFENPAIAALMNAHFINVKVDREERPDVDRLYMTFVQATTGSGGWPMSVWLQPDGKPFLGGTYFPTDDRYGRRGFPALLGAIAEAWKKDRAKIAAQSERVLDALRDMTTAAPADEKETLPDATRVLQTAAGQFGAQFDPAWGGFGDAPKFPRPAVLALLARAQSPTADLSPRECEQAREALLITLDRMAAGGMNDQLGGGFHRYSVDAFWHVPHFEKMLYDQAQLAVAYLDAFTITGEEKYADIARATLNYVLRDLTAPDGGFYCAEDADSLLAHGRPEHAEGAFYVWTKAEIEAALTPEEARFFCFQFGVEDDGNAPSGSDPHGEFTGKNVLIQRHTTAETAAHFSQPEHRVRTLLELAREKLFHLRKKRPRPHLDDKIVTAWNGLMISAFARAYAVLDEIKYLRAARSAADFIQAKLYRADDGIMLRSFRAGASRIEGFADDYAFLIAGLLDLFAADFRPADLAWAERLQAAQDRLFFDETAGGYFNHSARDATVLLRMKEDHDGAEPAASSVAALNLVRLAALTGRVDERRARAAQTLRAFSAQLTRLSQAVPTMVCALVAHHTEPRQVLIAGARDAADTRALLRAARRDFQPDLTLLFSDGSDESRWLAERLPYLANA